VTLFSTVCDSATIASIVSRWWPFSCIFNRSQVGGGRQSRCFWSKLPGEKGSVRQCVALMQQPVPGKAFAHFHCRRKTSRQYAELTVWPARMNSLRTILFKSKKIMSMLLISVFICLALFGLGEFGLTVYGSCFLPRTLV
jgi:hypothetical protein